MAKPLLSRQEIHSQRSCESPLNKHYRTCTRLLPVTFSHYTPIVKGLFVCTLPFQLLLSIELFPFCSITPTMEGLPSLYAVISVLIPPPAVRQRQLTSIYINSDSSVNTSRALNKERPHHPKCCLNHALSKLCFLWATAVNERYFINLSWKNPRLDNKIVLQRMSHENILKAPFFIRELQEVCMGGLINFPLSITQIKICGLGKIYGSGKNTIYIHPLTLPYNIPLAQGNHSYSNPFP